MSHEPIILDDTDWSKSFPLVQYNLNRCVTNIHDLRGEMHKAQLEATERRERDISIIRAQREADLQRIADRYDPLFSRLSSSETRTVVYGAIAGVVGGAVLSGAILFIFRTLS